MRDDALVLRDLLTGEEVEPPSPPFSVPIAFAADGRELVVIEPTDDPYRSVLASYEVATLERTELATVMPVYGAPRSSPDGRFVAFGSDGAAPNGIVLLDLEAGTAAQVTHDGAKGPLVWSADGRWLAYEAYDPVSSYNDLYVYDNVDGRAMRVTNDEPEDTPLRWTDDGGGILVSSHRGGDGTKLATSVWHVSVPSGELTEWPDAVDPEPYHLLSPNGLWDAAVDHEGELNLMTVATGRGHPIDMTGTGVDMTWSPSGDRLVWSSFRDGQFDLLMLAATRDEPTNLTRSPANETYPVWGPARYD